MTPRPRVRAVLAATSLLLVAGCGGNGHNRADVAFVQQMIPHHRQAVEMAKAAASHDAGPQVRALAARIAKAQGPEIATMSEWLDDWDASSGHDTGHMDGMMSDADMMALDASRGATFDRLFLTEMLRHHHGAVTMAKKELADGENGDAKDLADSIRDSQSDEIAEMRKLRADR